jgi:hypothetical protein
MLIALPTPLADAATVCLPSDPHSLTDRAVLYLGAHSHDGTHNFMTWNERKLAQPPVIVDQMNIAVAYAAMGDLNLNLVQAQIAWIILIRQQMCPSRVHRKTMYLTHQNLFLLEHSLNSARSCLMLQQATLHNSYHAFAPVALTAYRTSSCNTCEPLIA